MIDVSELITDPDFAVPYKVYRRTGKWVKGRFEVSEPKSSVRFSPLPFAKSSSCMLETRNTGL